MEDRDRDELAIDVYIDHMFGTVQLAPADVVNKHISVL